VSKTRPGNDLSGTENGWEIKEMARGGYCRPPAPGPYQSSNSFIQPTTHYVGGSYVRHLPLPRNFNSKMVEFSAESDSSSLEHRFFASNQYSMAAEP